VGHAKNNHKQQDLLDLITAIVQSQCSAHSKDSLTTVDTTSFDQHKHCTIEASVVVCEISDDVMVLILNFPWDMYGHEQYDNNNRLLTTACFLKSNDKI